MHPSPKQGWPWHFSGAKSLLSGFEPTSSSGDQASLVAQRVKNLPAIQETWLRILGWEDPLKKGMATHSSILAWRIPWTEEPGCSP